MTSFDQTHPPQGAGPSRPGRSSKPRLSIPRVILALACAVAVGAAGARAVVSLTERSTPPPFFAPYVDATLTPLFAFEDPAVQPAQTVVLSFVVADPASPCTPSWGGYHTLDEAKTAIDIERRIARLRQGGGDVVVSFGGALNEELALGCADQASLETAYRSVIDRYDPATIDVDLEGAALTDPGSAARRARALKALQQQRTASGDPLAIWLTLPVSPSGLGADALRMVDVMLAEGVDLAGVNVMTMNYGSSRHATQAMVHASVAALNATHRQIVAAWRRAGTELRGEQAWAKVGATPMIGRNDTGSDRFELDDARALVSFATSHHMGRLSMWSLNRDTACGPNADQERVSDHCSGVDQRPFAFNAVFKQLPGRPAAMPSVKPQALRRSLPPVDDPSTSPYPIWREDRAYPKGEEIVWRHNVYQAKWWTQGDQPDAPVAQEWDTPWRLVGPVLPGDRPQAEAPTLPPGTYPEWSPSQTFEKGNRVLREGHPYEAKWWTQGDAPGADVANEWETPWKAIDEPAG